MTLDNAGNRDDLVGHGDVAHCPSTVWFLVTILETDVSSSSRDLVHRPCCCWSSPGEWDVKRFGCSGRGMEKDEQGEGDWEEHDGGRINRPISLIL